MCLAAALIGDGAGPVNGGLGDGFCPREGVLDPLCAAIRATGENGCDYWSRAPAATSAAGGAHSAIINGRKAGNRG